MASTASENGRYVSSLRFEAAGGADRRGPSQLHALGVLDDGLHEERRAPALDHGALTENRPLQDGGEEGDRGA